MDNSITLTLSPPWGIRVRPSGVPYGFEFHPWRARVRVRDRDLWTPVTVIEDAGHLDLRLPHAGPWNVELSRGAFRSSLANLDAVTTQPPPSHDITFAESAKLKIQFGVRIARQPRLMLLPLRADGTPAVTEALRKEGVWNRTSATWALPAGLYHFALTDGQIGKNVRLWATSEPVALSSGQQTSVQLQPRTIAILRIIIPAGETVDWAKLTLHPEDRAIAWFAQTRKFRVLVTDKGPVAPLWPGTFALRDATGSVVYRIHVRAGDRQAALVSAR